MYSPRTGEKLLFTPENIIRRSIQSVGVLAIGVSVALEAKGIWEHDFGHMLRGLVGAGSGLGAFASAEIFAPEAPVQPLTDGLHPTVN